MSVIEPPTGRPAAAAGAAPADARPQPGGQSPPRILIADDAFGSRQLLARILHPYVRVRVVEARDGVEAVEMFRSSGPRLTFLDIDMPGMDGMAVLRQIREIDPKAFVVMVSACGSVTQVRDALALGIGGFVVKPYSTQRILDVLRRYKTATGDATLARA